MDINRLIDFYDKEQKTVLTAFLVNLPLCYAFLDMYRPSFLFSTAIGCYIAIRILRKEERDNADNDGA